MLREGWWFIVIIYITDQIQAFFNHSNKTHVLIYKKYIECKKWQGNLNILVRTQKKSNNSFASLPREKLHHIHNKMHLLSNIIWKSLITYLNSLKTYLNSFYKIKDIFLVHIHMNIKLRILVVHITSSDSLSIIIK